MHPLGKINRVVEQAFSFFNIQGAHSKVLNAKHWTGVGRVCKNSDYRATPGAGRPLRKTESSNLAEDKKKQKSVGPYKQKQLQRRTVLVPCKNYPDVGIKKICEKPRDYLSSHTNSKRIFECFFPGKSTELEHWGA